MKRISAFVAVLLLATVLLLSPLNAADKSPQQSGTVTSTVDRTAESAIERDARLAGIQTKTLPLSDYDVNWKTLSGGAGVGSSASWTVAVTFGQPIVGTGTNAEFTVSTGFWQQFGSGSCCMRRGDMDRSGDYTIADVTYLVDFLARGGEAPGCLDEGDVDASGELNIADLTYLVSFLFQYGPLPPSC